MIPGQSRWNIKFEFTAPNTPQQNGKAERKFATLKGRIRAMMNWGDFLRTLDKRCGLMQHTMQPNMMSY